MRLLYVKKRDVIIPSCCLHDFWQNKIFIPTWKTRRRKSERNNERKNSLAKFEQTEKKYFATEDGGRFQTPPDK